MAVATSHRRRRRSPWLFAILGVLLVPVACAAWIHQARDPAQHVAALDALRLPPSWELVRTDAPRMLLFQVTAVRFYLVDADPADVVPVLKDAAQNAGFYLYPAIGLSNGCGGSPGSSRCDLNYVTDDCRSNGPDGPITCWVEGYRRVDADPQHLEDLYASIAPRGSTVDYGPSASPRYVRNPNRALVTITASLTNPRHFWSAPTPDPSGVALTR